MSEPFTIDPGRVHTVHLTAIAGVGMASLAGMLQERGYEVRGSDQNVYPPMSTLLERLGIPVRQGYAAENLDPPPDLVIVGNAVSRTNPEVSAMLERGLPYLSMAEALRRFFLPGKRPLVVAGTHGKTTSTSMLAWVLHGSGRDPSLMVGGDALDFGGNYRLGAGEEFVLEGDEYDTAFFDKDAKFFHYEPRGLIVTSIEFDHADIYRDEVHVTDTFTRLLRLVPRTDPVVACSDFPLLETAVGRSGRSVERFGSGPAAEWKATEVRDDGSRTHFTVTRNGKPEGVVSTRLLGDINVRNALGVFALCRMIGLTTDQICPGLESFQGVRRRQQLLRFEPAVVLDDFAHHPTAIAGVIAAVRQRYAGRKVWAVFEPRSNTSRRRIFQDDFPKALAGADEVALAEVFFKKTDPLPPEERLSVDEIVCALRSGGTPAERFETPDAILDHLRGAVRPGDIVLFMSNGAFGNLPGRFADSFPDMK